jgi:hypothetical protein
MAPGGGNKEKQCLACASNVLHSSSLYNAHCAVWRHTGPGATNERNGHSIVGMSFLTELCYMMVNNQFNNIDRRTREENAKQRLIKKKRWKSK